MKVDKGTRLFYTQDDRTKIACESTGFVEKEIHMVGYVQVKFLETWSGGATIGSIHRIHKKFLEIDVIYARNKKLKSLLN